MIYNQNMAQQYNRNKILTATPAELTLLLYEGAIKFCNIAQVAIEKNDTEKAHTNIVKAEMIIEELQSTLNRKYPVAEDFDNVYKYIYSLLVDAMAVAAAVRPEIAEYMKIRMKQFLEKQAGKSGEQIAQERYERFRKM